MALNKIALQLNKLCIKSENVTGKSKMQISLFASYLIEISRQTGQDFHESMNYFLKLLLTRLKLRSHFSLDILLKSYLLFVTLMRDIVCDKYTVKTELEERVILSIINFAEYGNNSTYCFDIEEIFEDVDTYIKKGGRFSIEVKEALEEIIEKYK